MNKEDFLPIERAPQEEITSFIKRPSKWERFKVNRLAVVGATIIIVMMVLAILGPLISPYTYADQSLIDANQSPSFSHWFGTDTLGRDIYTRVMYGARISLTIGFVAAFINLVIGVAYGGIAGYIGGKVDRIMMGIVDVLYGIPLLLYVILLMVVLGPGLISIFVALGIAYWLNMARIVRSQILKVKNEEYIIAAEAMGIPKRRILLAFLSFIGLGVNAPMASWGVLASEGISSTRSYPFQLIFPAVAISITMLGFAFFGDGLRNVLDPKEGDR